MPRHRPMDIQQICVGVSTRRVPCGQDSGGAVVLDWRSGAWGDPEMEVAR
jgi:hypothetical protein